MSSDDTGIDDLVKTLITTGPQVKKIAELTDEQFKFSFHNATKEMGDDGYLVRATVQNFAAILTGNGAMTYGYLGPCGLNTPHTHPRGTEIQYLISGGPLATYMTMENGARTVKNTVNTGELSIFPRGSVHGEQNMACGPTEFLSSFDNNDPGTDSIASTFFNQDSNIIQATLDQIGVKTLEHLQVPTGVRKGVQDCFDRCGIDRKSFNFSATYADYAASLNSTWPIPSPLPASVSSAHLSNPTSGSSIGAAADTTPNYNNIPFTQNPLKNCVIGLSGATAGMMMLSMGLIFVLYFKRGRAKRAVQQPPMVAYTYTTPYDDSEILIRKTAAEFA